MAKSKRTADKPKRPIGRTQRSAATTAAPKNSAVVRPQFALPAPTNAAPAAAKSPAQTRRINLSGKPAAAVISGAQAEADSLLLVESGSSAATSDDRYIAGFIHDDGSAVQFPREGPGLLLSVAAARATFGELISAARRMLSTTNDAEASAAAGRLNEPRPPAVERQVEAKQPEKESNGAKQAEPTTGASAPDAGALLGDAPSIGPKGSPQVVAQSKSEEPSRWNRSSSTGAANDVPKSSSQDDDTGRWTGFVQSIADFADAHRSHASTDEATQTMIRAVDVSPDEATGRARGVHVAQMAAQQPLPFARERFRKVLRERIAALAGDPQAVRDDDRAQSVADSIKTAVVAEGRVASGPILSAAQQSPAEGRPEPGERLAMPASSPAPAIDVAAAVPPPSPSEEWSLADDTGRLEANLAAGGMDVEQLRRSGEPEFLAAAAAVESARAEASAAPERASAAESAVLSRAGQEAERVVAAGVEQIRSQRSTRDAEGLAAQSAGKSQLEWAHSRIALEMAVVYNETKRAVDERLARLNREAADAFDAGATAAKLKFYLALGEAFLSEVLSLFDDKRRAAVIDEMRGKFQADLETLVEAVADLVKAGLADVVLLLAEGRNRLELTVRTYGPADEAVAQSTAETFRQLFGLLEESIDERQNGLVETLTRKYGEVHEEVAAVARVVRDPAAAAIAWATELLAGPLTSVLEFRQLLNTVLARAAAAVDLIMSDPVEFLQNLITGVRLGVEGFLANLGVYLEKGLLDWLFGALTEAGIRLPERFDLAGLVDVAAQVLGLTWDNIRSRAVGILGEETVRKLELGATIVHKLATRGLVGAWEDIQAEAIAIIESVRKNLREFLEEAVIGAGIKWLLGLMTPASAFLKACIAIYDLVTFFIERGKQVAALVGAVLDSILSIAKGDVAPAAAAVEAALARSVPITIGFLANSLGLGNLSDKIRAAVEEIRAPINELIDRLIRKAADLAKKVFRRSPQQNADQEAMREKRKDEIVVPFEMAGESHHLYGWIDDDGFHIEMASKQRVALRRLLPKFIQIKLRGNEKEAADKLTEIAHSRFLEKFPSEKKTSDVRPEFDRSVEAIAEQLHLFGSEYGDPTLEPQHEGPSSGKEVVLQLQLYRRYKPKPAAAPGDESLPASVTIEYRIADSAGMVLKAGVLAIKTPEAIAIQDMSPAARAVRDRARSGGDVFKAGKKGQSREKSSQYLASVDPSSTPNFKELFGIPSNTEDFDFVLKGLVRPHVPIVTRPAPGADGNKGGGIEIVINAGDFIGIMKSPYIKTDKSSKKPTT